MKNNFTQKIKQQLTARQDFFAKIKNKLTSLTMKF